MAGNKDVILQLHKGLSSEEKDKFIQELQQKGAKVVKDDNINSAIMPFIVVSASPDHLAELQSAGLQGHPVVKHAEEDGEMHAL